MPNDNCLVCGGPLSDFETLRRRAWHDDCNKCPICNFGPLEEDLLTRQLARGQSIGHTGCIQTVQMQELKDKTIPMRLEQVQSLNKEMNTQWIVEPDTKDTDLLYEMLKTLHEVTANVSIILSRTKDRILQSEVQKYREKTKEEKTQEVLAKRATAQAEIDKAKRQETLAAERKDPALKLRRNAIEGWVRSGFSLDDATKMVDDMKGKTQ